MLLSVLICAVLTVTANASTQEWDGKSQLQSGFTYTISSKLQINSNLIIPQGTTIRILNGGELIFTTGTTVNLYGSLRVSNGGTLFTSGSLVTRPGSTLGVNGTMLCSLSSKVDVISAMTVRGEVRTSGVFNLHTNSSIRNSGEFRFLNSGNGTFSGNVINNSTLAIAGNLGVSLSGRITSTGNITITSKGRFLNSGRITLERDSAFHRFGTFKNTKSGRLTDNTQSIDRFLLSPQAISQEPLAHIYGIDVSFWQENIDWSKVAATNVEFVMIRAARGALDENRPIAEDTRFREYIAGAQANGLEVGVYLYSYAKTVAQIKQEAHFLVNMLSEFQITYPVVLDMEEKPEHYTDNPSEMAEAFLEIIAEAGYFPMIYSFKSWLEDNITSQVLDKYAVWVAHWYVPATTFRGNYYIWQYTDTGRVSGINADVDLNIAYRDFAAYIVGQF
jgi:GH25 family lysozyme M1 (1,4-beta-N-acetylmuramidase)